MTPAPPILTDPPIVEPIEAPAGPRCGAIVATMTYAVDPAAAAARLGLARPDRTGHAPGRLVMRLAADESGKGQLEVTLSLDGTERRLAAFPRVVAARARKGGLTHIDAAEACSARRLLAITLDGSGRTLFARSEAPTLADLPGGVYEPAEARVVEGL